MIDEVRDALSLLRGLPLWDAGRAATMLWLQLGDRMSAPSFLKFLLTLNILALGCGAEQSTASGGLHGNYHLRSVNGAVVPSATPLCCGATLDSGDIQVQAQDNIYIRRFTSTPPINGAPGFATVAIGSYVHRRANGGFALDAGVATTTTPPLDTLYVSGDTLLIVEGAPRWQQSVRSTWRYTP